MTSKIRISQYCSSLESDWKHVGLARSCKLFLTPCCRWGAAFKLFNVNSASIPTRRELPTMMAAAIHSKRWLKTILLSIIGEQTNGWFEKKALLASRKHAQVASDLLGAHALSKTMDAASGWLCKFHQIRLHRVWPYFAISSAISAKAFAPFVLFSSEVLHLPWHQTHYPHHYMNRIWHIVSAKTALELSAWNPRMAFHWKLRQGYFLQLCDSLGQQSRAQRKQEPTDQVNAKIVQNGVNKTSGYCTCVFIAFFGLRFVFQCLSSWKKVQKDSQSFFGNRDTARQAWVSSHAAFLSCKQPLYRPLQMYASMLFQSILKWSSPSCVSYLSCDRSIHIAAAPNLHHL